MSWCLCVKMPSFRYFRTFHLEFVNPKGLTLTRHTNSITVIMSVCMRSDIIALYISIIEPVHEISNNVACATSKASDQPAHTRSLIRAFDSRLSFL